MSGGSQSQPWEHYFVDILDRAWEQELATFLGDIAKDLADGFITSEIALERIKQIRRPA